MQKKLVLLLVFFMFVLVGCAGFMDLEDEDGNLVDVLDYVSVYPQIISPGEKAYYYESTILDDVSANMKLNIVLHPQIVKSKTPKVEYPVTDVLIKDMEFFGIEATGRVENTTDKDDSMVDIAIVLFNQDDKPILLLYTFESVNAGVKKGFSMGGISLPSKVKTSDIKRYSAFAFKYQYQFNF